MKTLFSKIKLDQKWKKVTLSKHNDFILVALKKTTKKSNFIDVDNIKGISLEVGINSGIKNVPLITDVIYMDFTKTTTISEEVNKITAMNKIMAYPSKFFIRVSSLTLNNDDVVIDGKAPIKISIEQLRLK